MTTTTSEARILQGRFRLLENRRGGMGTVWLAEDMLLDRAVALKELVPDRNGTDLSVRRERAMREAMAMAKVRHPAIVSVYDVFLEAGDPWIVMEYISGRSLEEVLRDDPLGERDIARIMLQVLNGLSATHLAGVVHRDVKPANILVADSSAVCLVDFGIAQIEGFRSITEQNTILGTADFLAPERILGERTGPPADLWSFGVTLFYALEGYLPFRRGDSRNNAWLATTYAIVYENAPIPVKSGGLSRMIMRLLSKDPGQRPGIYAVAEALNSVLDESASPGRPTQPRPDFQSAFRLSLHPDKNEQPGVRGNFDGGRELIRSVGPDAAAAILIAMQPKNAADILVGFELSECGDRLRYVAAARPRAAAKILQILISKTASRIMRYLEPEISAAILDAMWGDDTVSAGKAVDILSHLITADSKAATAAAVMMHLPAATAADLLRKLPINPAAHVVTQLPDATIEAIEAIDPALVTRLRRTSRAP